MASEWFYQVMGKQVGPVSSAELLALAQDGTVAHDTPVRKGPDGKWVSAARVKGLSFVTPIAPNGTDGRMESKPQVSDGSAINEVHANNKTFLPTEAAQPVVEPQAPLFLEGRQGRSVIVHGTTVKIINKAGVFAARREKILPIRHITSVEVKEPGAFFAGFVRFSIAGGQSLDTSDEFDAALDENSVVFDGTDNYVMALEIKTYIEWFTETDSQASPKGLSIADEIVKLKRLTDEGILTKEEFEAKKKQLLGI
jgi:hypothetical protein